MRCAYLTMADMGDYVADADLSIAPMAALGWDVDTVPWRGVETDWDNYDAVYIGTPWDYPDDAAAFLALLEQIDASRAVLVNDIELVRWSVTKTYLHELEQKGADIVPSLWFDRFDRSAVGAYFSAHDTDTVVIKPQVGANAAHTYVLSSPVDAAMLDELDEVFANRPHFVQPFVRSIQTDGEYSLFFFSGDYSHAIRKLPKAGDFRSQEEHGADIQAIEKNDMLVAAAQKTLALVEPQPVYARADFVRRADGRYLLMELELIEPSLYLRSDPDAPQRFARAFDAYIRQRVSSPAA